MATPPTSRTSRSPVCSKTLVATGAVKAAPPEVVANVDKNMPDWKNYGTVDGTFYAAALGANVKSFVWYSPPAFADKGYEIPKTWADLLALSEKIASDNGWRRQALVCWHRVR